jgi:hypothetical protein
MYIISISISKTLEEVRLDEAMRSGKISLLLSGFVCAARSCSARLDIATPSNWQVISCRKPLLHIRVMPAPSLLAPGQPMFMAEAARLPRFTACHAFHGPWHERQQAVALVCPGLAGPDG